MKTMKHYLTLCFFVLSLLCFESARAGEHLIQPGDLIRILLPGESSLDKSFEVDRQGRMLLPEVGPVEVAALTEDQMQQTVSLALAAVFRDLTGLRVIVEQRRMRINVLGFVENPGEVVLPASASVQMALREAGGLKAGAQLDRLQLRRDGSKQVFNYKAYLDSGDETKLPELRSLDAIFVPASPKIGNVAVEFDPSSLTDKGDAAEDRTAVKVFGEVYTPGSYSYKEGANLLDMLMRAGGVTRYASVDQIKVIVDNQPILVNLSRYLESGDETWLPKLAAGTTIFVPKQQEEIRAGANTVYVMGEVFKPGAYEGNENVEFLDVLANAGGPTRFAETRQIRVIRQQGGVERFDLLAFTEGMGETPPLLLAGDAIFVPEKTDLNEKSWTKVAPSRAVKVMGEVNRPGRYEWSDEMSLLDLLAHAGGPKPNADTAKIQLIIPTGEGLIQPHVFDLNDFVKGKLQPSDLPQVVAGTLVMVPELPDDPSDNKSQWVRQASEDSIYLFGQLGAPGRYRFEPDMHFLDILAAADGPTQDADLANVRVSHRNQPRSRVTHLDLALYFETGDESLLPNVLPGDTIFIPEKKRSWLSETKASTIRVLGAVNKPGRYRFNDDMTLLDLIAEAGGIKEEGYPQSIAVVNLSCCQQQARSFDLTEFAKTGDFSMLPLLRAGDTVYVPSESDTDWAKARRGLGDIFQAVTLGALLGFL